MKRRNFYLLFVLLFAAIGIANAQMRSVTGVVTDEQNEPLIQASIRVLNDNTRGAVTDLDGRYSIQAAPGEVLVFSYVGYKTQKITLGNQTVINVKLLSDATQLEGVVVTAMGIKRSEKSLPYATQKVDGSALTQVPSTNFLSNLSGKTAGLQVSGSGSSVGSSVKILLRGNRSINGNNQPLYVVDGTPINSGAFSQTGGEGGYGGGIDVGDGLAVINPNDIEDINVLKGASAAALYGSHAANGVIMITTKRGKAGVTSVSVHSSFQADVPYMTYKFQDQYGMGVDGAETVTAEGWGPKKSINNDFIRDFFRTGTTFINGVTVSGGTEKLQNFFSYQNTTASGILDKNRLEKHNVSLRSTTSLFEKFMDVDASVALTKQNISHAPTAPGQYFNPLIGLYLYPDGNENFQVYKKEYEKMDAKTNMLRENWAFIGDINHNPYWLINNHNYSSKLYKAITKVNLTFNLTEYLKFILRGSYDRSWITNERKVAATAFPSGPRGGRYDHNFDNAANSYGDAMLQFNKDFNGLSVMATLGSSISDNKIYKESINLGDLQIPGIYHFKNYLKGGRPGVDQKKEHRQLQSVFATTSLGWKDVMYLDLTARNDWSSTLPASNRSYFYPSVGTSVIFSKWLKDMGYSLNWMNFGKLRASWTSVGNDMPWGLTNPLDELNDGGDIKANTIKPFTDLKPERSNSFEVGLNLRMLDNRLTFDLAWYQTKTKNQYFLVDNTSGTGYSKYYINAGEVRNRGFEGTIGFTPIRTEDFEWTGYLNFSMNKNKVLSLPEQYDKEGLSLSKGGFNYRLFKGKEWGEMYSERLLRDEQGRVILSKKEGDKDFSLAKTKEEERIGNVNPKFLMGLRNEIRYKDFTLGFLIDGRFGGDVISLTEAKISAAGRSQQTADARNNGGFSVPAVQNILDKDGKVISSTPVDRIDAQLFYKSAPASEFAMYKATNIRLRELSLAYALPSRLFENTNWFKGATVSLIGRNLFFIYRDAPYDPEIALTTSGNGGTNADNFSLPSTRSFGLSINLNF
ncbi:SusC/RagA family TonB-linked outer membrane protein [Porphyromonas macacae]|uniref:SusC/RagA family TonB-linked outer membrane protein n=1 Tax=Porphyromonas macacae TaxID=28115 RepID=UPI000689EB0C|nr:SusC/RagA family TonB-linked outer membrane protein [Porphyromonas macacae]